MTKDQVKAWASFYRTLLLVAAWNGICRFAGVLVGAGGAQVMNVVDLRKIGMAGAGWILCGTILASIGGALYANQITLPPKPTDP